MGRSSEIPAWGYSVANLLSRISVQVLSLALGREVLPFSVLFRLPTILCSLLIVLLCGCDAKVKVESVPTQVIESDPLTNFHDEVMGRVHNMENIAFEAGVVAGTEALRDLILEIAAGAPKPEVTNLYKVIFEKAYKSRPDYKP